MSFDPSDQRRAKKLVGEITSEPKADIDADISNVLTGDFSTFQSEGNVFAVKPKKGKKGFIPPSPRTGLDNVFGSDSIDVSNMKVSTKLTKRFFDF